MAGHTMKARDRASWKSTAVNFSKGNGTLSYQPTFPGDMMQVNSSATFPRVHGTGQFIN